MNNQPNEPLSSVDAASLLISDGATKDPSLANHIQQGGSPFNMDALQRSHLTRMMGFEFDIEINEFENYVKVWSTEGPEVTCVSKYEGTFNEETVDLLVDTCLEVKMAWDKTNSPDEVVEGEVVETEDND